MKNSNSTDLFQLQYVEPSYYTRIPNILDHLTYTDEKGHTQRLSVYAKELYRILRESANDHGACWKNTKKLAYLVNCSVGSIVNAKRELMQSFHQLDGQSLIFEKKKKKANFSAEKMVNKSTYCIFTILYIWKYNDDFMKRKKKGNSCHETENGPDSHHEIPSQGVDSPHETNNIHIEKDSLCIKKQDSPDGRECPVSSTEKNMFPSDDISLKTFNYLTKLGFALNVAINLMKKFTRTEIELASQYMKKIYYSLKQKGKKILNKPAYFTSILEKGYWKEMLT